MSYISYFDLLGTRGFCEDHNIYFDNMEKFYKAIVDMSCFLKGHGRIGIFSDCAYAESNDLQCLLQFLTELRDRLISDGLFFNAVVKAGQLGVDSISKGVKPKCRSTEEKSSLQEDLGNEDKPTVFGVKFTEKDIAKLYILQSNFKGIGIYIDKNITDKEIYDAGYRITKCFFMSKTNEDGKKWIPVEYRDIAFNPSRYGDKSISNTLSIILSALYSSYVKAPNYGIYYISILCNIIRSYRTGFKWNLSINKFEEQPVAFNVIFNILSNYHQAVEHIVGIENLLLIMLDEIYNCSELHYNEKRDITKLYVNKTCLRTKYIHSLNTIPGFLFSNTNKNNSNKNLFIRLCQEIFSTEFVHNVITTIQSSNPSNNWREDA